MPDAPATTAPSAPSPTETATASAPAGSNFHDAFAKLDQIIADAPATEAPKDEAPAKPAEPKVEAKPAEKPAEAKPAEAPKVEAKPADEPDVNQMAPKQLRKAYAEMKEKLAKIQAEREAAADPREHPDFKAVSEKLTAAEKRRMELEDNLRYTNFERSQEYKEKYEAPFIEAYNEGRSVVSGLKLTDPGTQEFRQAKPEDFDLIMRITNDEGAAEAIEALFGSGVKATMVANARRDAIKANQSRLKAIDDFRKTGSEREKAQQEQAERMHRDISDNYTKAVKEGEQKYAQWSKPAEGDVKAKEVLERDAQLADVAFFGANGMTREQISALSPELQKLFDASGKVHPVVMAKLHAAARNKVAWFGHVNHKLAVANGQLTALKEKLARFEKSEPGPGDGAAPAAKKADTADDILDRMASTNR